MTSSTTNRESTAFERFVASSAGRTARVALGVVISGTGLMLVSKAAGLALVALGLVPVATGVLNLCPIAPLWGGHFLGARYCRREGSSSG